VTVAALLVISILQALPLETGGYKTPGGWSINGDQEILADPVRPIIYWAHPVGNTLSFLDAFTGTEISRLTVGQGPMSVSLSSDGSRLYVAVSGENQTTVVDPASRTVVRTIPLAFSPLSVVTGQPGRLYVSGAQDDIVSIVNETTGSVISQATLFGYPALLEVNPNKTLLLAVTQSDPVRLVTYDVSGNRLVLLVADSGYTTYNFFQMAVDWETGLVYLVAGAYYQIDIVSLATLTRIGWLPMWAYPQGVGLMPDRDLVIGINLDYDSGDLWVFNTTTQARVNKVPIRQSPSGYFANEESLMVASEVAGTVLLWTEELLWVITLDPSISPGNPAPGSNVAGYPGFFVSAHVWPGLIQPGSNTTTISVDGRTLYSVYDSAYDLVRAVAPVLPVGRHQVAAEIAWPGGSKSVTWNFTVTSPPPVPNMVIRTSAPFQPGEPIEFDGSASSAALGTIVTFDWTFGDGSTFSGARATHAFTVPGVYRVTLVVTTDLNVSGYDARDVFIEAAPSPPSHPPESAVDLIVALWIGGSLVAALTFVLLWRRGRRGPRHPEASDRANPPPPAGGAWP